MQVPNTDCETTTIVVEVPRTVVEFIEKWAELGGHQDNDVLLSVLSHGLLSLTAIQNLGDELVDMIVEATADLATMAPKGATVIEVNMGRRGKCPKCGRRH